MISPERRRQAVEAARQKYGLSERRACRIVGQPRGTQRYVPTLKPDEDELTRSIVHLASEYGRYGYRSGLICRIRSLEALVNLPQNCPSHRKTVCGIARSR